MYEQWHPLGVVGIISAFNFPVAVWAWNSALAWVCGDVCIWKPSEKTPLCGVACQNIWSKVAAANNLPEGIGCMINGNYEVGEYMTTDKRVPLISATGSSRMGRIVGATVAERFGKSLLELGGNNAIIVTPDGRTHLEKLCQQVIEQGENAETVLNEQNEKIEHSKTDAALLIKNKKSLAVRWLHVSLKQLLYRDRHLFQTLPEKAA